VPGSDKDEGEGEDNLFHLSADATLREWMQKAGVDVEQVGHKREREEVKGR
jgi:hypothetical protein